MNSEPIQEVKQPHEIAAEEALSNFIDEHFASDGTRYVRWRKTGQLLRLTPKPLNKRIRAKFRRLQKKYAKTQDT